MKHQQGEQTMLDKTNPTYCAIRSYVISGIGRTDGATQQRALEKADTLLGMLHIQTSSGFEETAEETETPWLDRRISDEYFGWNHRYAHFTWRAMGRGSEGGGRHEVLKWLARRGRPNYNVDVKRLPGELIAVPYRVTCRAREVLNDCYEDCTL
jgi:hypothetical protein